MFLKANSIYIFYYTIKFLLIKNLQETVLEGPLLERLRLATGTRLSGELCLPSFTKAQ